MAFPTSSLTNNQVHKEGNRAFVYDSTLGVWDQVRETDIIDRKNLYGEIDLDVTGTLGAGVTFPAGHVIQTVTSTIEGGSRGHNTKLIADRSEIHSDYRSSIIPQRASSKILIRYTSRSSYISNAKAGFAVGYEVTASGGSATAGTLKDQLVVGENYGLVSQVAEDEDSYFFIHTTAGGGTYRALTMESFHSPSYTLGQKIWYGVISYGTAWHYFSLNGDVNIIITEIAG